MEMTCGKNENKPKREKNVAVGKDVAPISVVLNVEMHCEGCAQKVRQSVNSFKGVVAAASDVSGNKLTVIGNVNPFELRGHLESKTHKKVDLISPAMPIKKDKKSSKTEGKLYADKHKTVKSKEHKKEDNKKSNEPSATSVVLRIRLHCEGCILRIRRNINKIKGVANLSIDSENDLVTVSGTMDVNSLPGLLSAKLKKVVEIVNAKKDGDGHKEESEKLKGRCNETKSEGQEFEKITEEVAVLTSMPAAEENKIEHHNGEYDNNPYRIEMMKAPQLFSDENPNACSVM